ncbi:MAG: flagellar biosynthetic protein FliR [Roseobacter sp.]|jgi:flagellar biosynthetic protein FliR|nr:flagellar biosynthetic protein FliR [Roseobacter sp.]
MTALEQVLTLLNQNLLHGFAVFLRVSAIVAMLPAFGEQSVPVRIKLAVAVAFTAIVAPAVPLGAQIGSLTDLIFLTFTEAASGLLIGIGVRLLVIALQIAGSIAAQSTSLSQVLGGAAVDPIPAMGYILVVGGLALATLAGLHVKATGFIVLSYDFLPFGRFVEPSAISEWGTHQVAKAFSLAFSLAAPFIVLSVLYNFALGAINRAMPQLMVAFVGAPVTTLGGLALLMISAPFMLEVWLEALNRFMLDPFGGRQ